MNSFGTPTQHDQGVGQYCGHCGSPAVDGDHSRCRVRLRFEPPRFCAQCRRRMKVQVDPVGWTAACSVHDAIAGENGR